jgi:4-hydroxy-3-polyprenylbenzoate decarboxylase
MKKVVVAISGASGVHLGKRVLEQIPDHIDVELIISGNAQTVFKKEELNNSVIVHDNANIAASIASGSYKVDAMMVIPCSMNTLAKIAHGISDNLITRAAAVTIKERRTLLLAPREMPFSAIALENMLKLSQLGVIIAPPVAAYYAKNSSVEQMEDFFIGKWFDLLGIEHQLYQRWEVK